MSSPTTQRKPVGHRIPLMQRGFGGVEAVQVAHQALDAELERIAEQLPVDLAVVTPFMLLRDLAAHKQQLLAGMTPHVTEIGTQVGKALPVVARHLTDQRALSVHHLVV